MPPTSRIDLLGSNFYASGWGDPSQHQRTISKRCAHLDSTSTSHGAISVPVTHRFLEVQLFTDYKNGDEINLSTLFNFGKVIFTMYTFRTCKHTCRAVVEVLQEERTGSITNVSGRGPLRPRCHPCRSFITQTKQHEAFPKPQLDGF